MRLQGPALGDGFLPCLSEVEEEKEAYKLTLTVFLNCIVCIFPLFYGGLNESLSWQSSLLYVIIRVYEKELSFLTMIAFSGRW